MIGTSWKRASTKAESMVRSGRFSLLSLDVFDTLLLRTTTPEFVAAATARRVAERLRTSEASAASARARAWRIETSRSVMEGRCEDARMIDHFRVWIRLMSSDRMDADEIDAIATHAMRTELADEAATLVPNPHMRTLLDTAHATGIATVALSDMYMSSSDVAALLDGHGMLTGLDSVVTSGETGMQKRTGRLFDWLLETRGLSGDRVLHVGDDVLADWQRPRSRGIAALAVRDRVAMTGRFMATASEKAASTDPDTAGFMVADAAARGTTSSDDDAFELGRTGFGPILSAFAHGVHENALRDGVSSVWFMAREGALLRSLYEQAAVGLGAVSPPSAYLYVSRLASLRTRLTGFGRHEIDSAFANTPTPTYGKLLAPLRLDPKTASSVMAAAGLDAASACEPAGIAALLADMNLQAAASEIGAAERNGFRIYLERTGFPTSGRIAVVDVGWGCQIQENLEKTLEMLGIDVEIVGYYLGTNSTAARRRSTGIRSIPILCDTETGDGCGAGAFSFVQPLELACRSPHGSVIGYGADGTPLLAEDGGAGRSAERVDDPVICRIQEGVLAFAGRYFRLAGMARVGSAQSAVMGRFALDRLSLLPSRSSAAPLVGLNNVANLGMDEGLMIGGRVSVLRPGRLVRTLRGTLWQEGTTAMAVPIAGPAALLAFKRIRRGIPIPSGVPVPNRRWNGAPGTSVPAPVDLGLIDVDTIRTALSGLAPSRASSDTALFGCADATFVAYARLMSGAPWRPALAWWTKRLRLYISGAIRRSVPAEYAKVVVRRTRGR